jgi:hypothetical protein
MTILQYAITNGVDWLTDRGCCRLIEGGTLITFDEQPDAETAARNQGGGWFVKPMHLRC